MSKNVEDEPKKDKKREDAAKKHPKRKHRGAPFESGDPTLARQFADDPFGSKRRH